MEGLSLCIAETLIARDLGDKLDAFRPRPKLTASTACSELHSTASPWVHPALSLTLLETSWAHNYRVSLVRPQLTFDRVF